MDRRHRACPALRLSWCLDEADVVLHRQTWVCGSVGGFLASGPDRVAQNEMVDARARVLCSPSLREGTRLGEDDDC